MYESREDKIRRWKAEGIKFFTIDGVLWSCQNIQPRWHICNFDNTDQQFGVHLDRYCGDGKLKAAIKKHLLEEIKYMQEEVKIQQRHQEFREQLKKEAEEQDEKMLSNSFWQSEMK